MSQKRQNRPQTSPANSAKLALFIAFNAMVVQEALATFGRKGVNPLSMKPSGITTKDWLIGEWTHILDSVDYEPVFRLARNLLQGLPSHPVIERILNDLMPLASRIVASKALLKHDIAGRIYHTLLLRRVAKGLATYYTSIPAAYLLAKLAVETPDDQTTWKEADKTQLVVADLACGSGTLLSAAYSAVLDRWAQYRIEEIDSITDEQIGLFHKNMLENCIYGFDVLEYATHLAAAWLTLRMPEIDVRKQNIYTLPLGRMGGTSHNKKLRLAETYLGSLSMDIDPNTNTCVFRLAKSLMEEPALGPEQAGLVERKREPIAMPRPRLIIMNPPFARTGNVGKSILFGHLRKAEREVVLAKLRESLAGISKELGGAIGKAGLAAPFIRLAHHAVADNGRLAFVLPKVSTSGPSWEPIRKMLGTNYKIEHIVASYDPAKNWAWSENTVLSEILLVCTKQPPDQNTRTKVTHVYSRPRSALEAKILASRIIEAQPEGNLGEYLPFKQIDLGGKRAATCYSIRQQILTACRNWNVCAGFASDHLSRAAWLLMADNEFLNHALPLVPLAEAVEEKQVQTLKGPKQQMMIGFDVHTFQADRRDHGGTIIDVLEGAKIETLSRIEIAPNKEVRFASDSEIPSRMSSFLITGVARFRLNTVGLVSVCCKKPVASNTMWTVRFKELRGIQVTDCYKIQVLWLNSTPGLLHFLSLRQDHNGPFVQFKKGYLPLLKLLDVTKLSNDQRKSLLVLYEELNGKNVQSISKQLEEAREKKGFRYTLDTRLLEIVAPTADSRLLSDLYEEMLDETIIRVPPTNNSS